MVDFDLITAERIVIDGDQVPVFIIFGKARRSAYPVKVSVTADPLSAVDFNRLNKPVCV